MTYDEAAFRAGEESAEPAHRISSVAASEQRRRAELVDSIGDTYTEPAAHRAPSGDPDGNDRLGVHFGWEVVLLVAATAIALVLYRHDATAFKRPALDTLLITGTAIGLLTLGGGLTLRAGVPNLALGPIALGASLQFAENSDHGLVKAAVPAVIIALIGGVAVGLLIIVLHVPGWAATLAAALGVITYDQLRVHPVNVQGHYHPNGHATLFFGAFALLAVLGGALGTIPSVRRWLGQLRTPADPATRRSGALLPVLVSLALSSVFAVIAGVLLATQSTGPINPGTGIEWTGIAVGLAMLAGTSGYGRRGGIFGTLFAVIGLTAFLDYSDRRHLGIAMFAVAGSVLGGGLIVTRLVETYGRPLSAGADDWTSLAATGPDWSSDLPKTWTPAPAPNRTDQWDDGPWGASR